MVNSCRSIITRAYGINKNIDFQHLNEYKDYAVRNYHIDTNKLYFIGRDNYNSFITEVSMSGADLFFGTFLNDSTEIKKSSSLTENQSCSGRVLSEITGNTVNIHAATQRNNLLKTNVLYNSTTNQPLSFANNKIKVVLLYSYKSGSIRKQDFQEIQQIIDKTTTHDLAIVAIDYLPFMH